MYSLLSCSSMDAIYCLLDIEVKYLLLSVGNNYFKHFSILLEIFEVGGAINDVLKGKGNFIFQ